MSDSARHAVMCCVALAGCSAAGPVPVPLPHQQVVIERWMQCQECDRSELDSVTALGQAAVPRLRDYLLNGPEPERVDRVRAHLERSHDSTSAHSPQPLHMRKAQLVQTFLGNLDAVYRARSARALREIGGDTARVALDSARHLNLRRDVLQEVQAALDSMPP
jgi:hypothetical protein